MARFYNPLPKGSLTADDTAPEQGYRYLPTAPDPRKVPNPLTLEAPPTLTRDARGAREGGLLAALGALLGGRADLAGRFGASYMGGVRQGEDNRFARDTQQWQQQRQNDLALNQNKMQLFGLEGQEAQRRFGNQMTEANNLFRWNQADEAKQQRAIGNQRADLSQRSGVLRQIAALPSASRAQAASALGWPAGVPLPDMPEPAPARDPNLSALVNYLRDLLRSPYTTPEMKAFANEGLQSAFRINRPAVQVPQQAPTGSPMLNPAQAMPGVGMPSQTAIPQNTAGFYPIPPKDAEGLRLRAQDLDLRGKGQVLKAQEGAANRKLRASEGAANRGVRLQTTRIAQQGASARQAQSQAFQMRMDEIRRVNAGKPTPMQTWQAKKDLAKMREDIGKNPAAIMNPAEKQKMLNDVAALERELPAGRATAPKPKTTQTKATAPRPKATFKTPTVKASKPAVGSKIGRFIVKG